MKKIGLLLRTMNGGGAERVASHLTHILGKSYDVHLILFEDTYMEYECAGTFHNLDVPAVPGGVFTKLKLLRKRIARLKKLVQQEKLDCLISFLDSPNVVNLLTGTPGCRKVVSIRNYDAPRNNLRGKLADGLMKLLYKRADRVVPVSKVIAQLFHSRYDIPEEKLQVIYNPYDFDTMTRKAAEPLTPGEEAFYGENFNFINVGRVMPQKGIWHLLKAFSQVCAQAPQARLVLVGEDYTKGKLPRLIEELGIGDKVLCTGRTRNPYKYLKNADCYVLSSLFEGFPNAMVEAMACGCAIVATDCKSGPREILYDAPRLEQTVTEVTEADYGILVPPLERAEDWSVTESTEGEKLLAAAMLSACTQPEMTKTWAQKAQLRSGAFDFETAHRAFRAVIED